MLYVASRPSMSQGLLLMAEHEVKRHDEIDFQQFSSEVDEADLLSELSDHVNAMIPSEEPQRFCIELPLSLNP